MMAEKHPPKNAPGAAPGAAPEAAPAMAPGAAPGVAGGDAESGGQDGIPDGGARRAADALAARAQRCLSCNACRPHCDVSLATGRLRPLHMVRLASLGLLSSMLDSPAVWYCQQCRQCSAACPNDVRPATLIRAVRRELLCRREGASRILDRYEALAARLQRVRWHLVARLCEGRDVGADAAGQDLWSRWGELPVASAPAVRVHPGRTEIGAVAVDEANETALSVCMTCNECTTVCPVAHERSVFDPLSLFRMAALGLHDELLASPSLWLCLGCGRCSETCTQGVNGRRVIRRLQQAAVAQGRVPADLPDRISALDRTLLRRFQEQVDALLSDGVARRG